LDSLFKTGKSGTQWYCVIPGTLSFSGLDIPISIDRKAVQLLNELYFLCPARKNMTFFGNILFEKKKIQKSNNLKDIDELYFGIKHVLISKFDVLSMIYFNPTLIMYFFLN